ncbi:MAG: hypothetical protein ACOVOQ_11275 [Flavobacterium sp.]
MTSDQNKGITNITYNHLNLPKQITFANNNSIVYVYNALGIKIRKTVTEADTQATTHNADYVFNIVHKKNELFSNYIGMISENLGFMVIFV